MEYAINIKETLSRTIIVEADDLCEALQNVEDAANEGASYARDRGKPGHDGRGTREPSWRMRPHHELPFL